MDHGVDISAAHRTANGLTERQNSALAFIRRFIHERGFAPSYREIMRHLGLSSVGSIHKLVQELRRRGALEILPGRSRSITPQGEHSHALVEVPINGFLTADRGRESWPEAGRINFPEHLIPQPSITSGWKIKGNGFVEDLLGDGDLLLLESHTQVENGALAVIVVNQSACLIKCCFYKEESIQLAHRYGHHHPFLISRTSAEILGKVIGVWRE